MQSRVGHFNVFHSEWAGNHCRVLNRVTRADLCSDTITLASGGVWKQEEQFRSYCSNHKERKVVGGGGGAG